MRILLINPPNVGILKAVGVHFPPIGLLYLAAYLEREGYRPEVRDLCVAKGAKGDIRFRDYDVVGIGTDTTRYYNALRIAKAAKGEGCTVIMGGPHPCFVDEEVLNTGQVDFVVHGEGEITLHELLVELQKERGDFSSIRGISFASNGQITRSPRREFVQDLDQLPLPARHLIDMDDYRKTKFGNRDITPMITSRGCPSNCSFCSSSTFFGRKWRGRSVPSILREIEELYYRYHFNAIAFVDDNFTLSPQRVMDLSEGIIQKNLDIWWWNFSRVDTIVRNEQLLKKMRKAGAKTIYIGVESAHRQSLEEFGKRSDIGMAERAVGVLKRNGFEIFASYILGGLSETVKAVNETIRWAKRLDTNVAQFSILTPYPGTALYEEVKDRIFRRHWTFFDAQHLVFKHDHISFIRLQWLLLKANLLYYSRSRKGRMDVLNLIKRHRLGVGTLLRFTKDYFIG
jgi:anaerobic magnesium-protoporphyrin IX monomethyl ester cyclase